MSEQPVEVRVDWRDALGKTFALTIRDWRTGKMWAYRTAERVVAELEHGASTEERLRWLVDSVRLLEKAQGVTFEPWSHIGISLRAAEAILHGDREQMTECPGCKSAVPVGAMVTRAGTDEKVCVSCAIDRAQAGQSQGTSGMALEV